MSEADEILLTIDNLRQALENLLVRGLASAGAGELNTLAALGREFERIGAGHLAGCVAALHGKLQNEPRAAAAELLKAQASLRVFERILTLESAAAALSALASVEA